MQRQITQTNRIKQEEKLLRSVYEPIKQQQRPQQIPKFYLYSQSHQQSQQFLTSISIQATQIAIPNQQRKISIKLLKGVYAQISIQGMEELQTISFEQGYIGIIVLLTEQDITNYLKCNNMGHDLRRILIKYCKFVNDRNIRYKPKLIVTSTHKIEQMQVFSVTNYISAQIKKINVQVYDAIVKAKKQLVVDKTFCQSDYRKLRQQLSNMKIHNKKYQSHQLGYHSDRQCCPSVLTDEQDEVVKGGQGAEVYEQDEVVKGGQGVEVYLSQIDNINTGMPNQQKPFIRTSFVNQNKKRKQQRIDTEKQKPCCNLI